MISIFNLITKEKIISRLVRNFGRTIEDASETTPANMKRALKSFQIKYDEGHTCWTIDCPVCAPKTAKIYINKTTGYFTCQCNKYRGGWMTIEKYFGAKNDLKTFKDMCRSEKIPFDTKQIHSSTRLINKCSQETLQKIFDLFNLNESSISGLVALGCRFDKELNTLYVPLLDADGRICGYKLIDRNGESIIPPGDCCGVPSARSSRSGGNSAVITSSLKDALHLIEARVPGHVVCLPYGVSSLPQSVLPCFEKYGKITLWLGSDVTASHAAVMFAKKLGERRCHVVRSSEGNVVDCNHGDVRMVVVGAKPVRHEAITTFARLRQDVLAELSDTDRAQGVKWRRFPSLSKILRGHRRGELTVLTGPTGCGKTTFASEYSLDLAEQGVNTLWGSFEIRNARLARTMLQQMAGADLSSNLDRFDEWADCFEKLPIYFMTFHGQQPVRVVMDAVEHATYVHDIHHVIVDNVQFMMGMAESESRHSDRFWKQDAIVAAFRTFATKSNCHVTLVMHPRKERDAEELTTSSIFGGAKASQEADNVLIIQDRRLVSVRGKKYLQVVKNRYSGDLGIMPLDFDKDALSYAQKKKKQSEEKSQKTTEESHMKKLSTDIDSTTNIPGEF